MNYIVTMMDGSKVAITEQEYKNMAGKTGLVHAPSCDTIINLSSVVIIRRSDDPLQIKSQKNGRLHDGTRVIKKFGQWIDEYSGVSIDSTYYPEVAEDTVMSEEEWENRQRLLSEGTISGTAVTREDASD